MEHGHEPIRPVPSVHSPGASTWSGPAAGTGGGQIPPAPSPSPGENSTPPADAPGPPPLAPAAPPVPPPGPGGNVYGRGGGGGKMNLLGYLSLAFGALGSICCCCPGLPFVGGIPAVVLGYLHLQRVKKGQATMAWLGWVGIGLGVLALIVGIISLTTGVSDYFRDQYDRQIDGR